jgi:hypothetical protein
VLLCLIFYWITFLDKSLVKLAKKAAKEEDLIYAPDIAALGWMYRFSRMVAIKERESCAQLIEDAGHPDLAKLIRDIK